MGLAAAPRGEPLRLRGPAFARGRAQAELRADCKAAVQAAVEARLAEIAPLLARPDSAAFLAAQRAATERLYPEALAEIEGLAAGFALPAERLFAYLHASTMLDRAACEHTRADGCTAFALRTAEGAFLAKNRDYREEHRALQQVMLHEPDRGLAFLVIGSLGAPGCFSSGVNAAGLALADTATHSRDLGPGLHRYFLLTLLLHRCASVEEALARIQSLPHTGGGCLVLADAGGALAAVELGHRRLGIERPRSRAIGRTNHHRLAATAPANLVGGDRIEAQANSIARLACLGLALDRLEAGAGPDAFAALLARHADAEGPAFCRHGGPDGATTISGALWDTVRRRLWFCAGPPCRGGWRRFDLAPEPAAQAKGSPIR